VSPLWLKLIPSAISSVRIVVGLAFPWLPHEWRLIAAASAALTDLIDGPISRLLNVAGKFGQLLDPIADKIFLACVLGTVLAEAGLPWWEIGLVGTRDVLVLLACGVIACVDGRSALKKMRPRLLGKTTTAAQFGFVLAFCLGAEILTHVLAITSAILGSAAVIDYVIAYRALRSAPAA